MTMTVMAIGRAGFRFGLLFEDVVTMVDTEKPSRKNEAPECALRGFRLMN
jgi:hypothetical protein